MENYQILNDLATLTVDTSHSSIYLIKMYEISSEYPDKFYLIFEFLDMDRLTLVNVGIKQDFQFIKQCQIHKNI